MAISVVLVRPRNPLNIGAVARAMANFGFSDLRIVAPFETIWRETRSAPGAEDLVRNAQLYSSLSEAVKDVDYVLGTSSFHARPFEHAIVQAQDLPAYLQEAPSATLVFGSERSGLSNEELAACRAIIRIPTAKQCPSMNLGQAVAIILYALTTTSSRAQETDPSTILETSKDLSEAWIDLARQVGYPPGYTEAARRGRILKALASMRWTPEAKRLSLSLNRWVIRKLGRRSSE